MFQPVIIKRSISLYHFFNVFAGRGGVANESESEFMIR